MSEINQFIQICVEKKQAGEAQQAAAENQMIQEHLDAWFEALQEVMERLPQPLQAYVDLPPYRDWVERSGPDEKAFMVVRLGGGDGANLRVYLHPGELRYPENGDYYSRVPRYEVGLGRQRRTYDDGETFIEYGHWAAFDDLEMAVAAAYEELQRPLPEQEDTVKVVDVSSVTICPLLMAAQPDNALLRDSACIGDQCAWWVRSGCALAVLAGGWDWK